MRILFLGAHNSGSRVLGAEHLRNDLGCTPSIESTISNRLRAPIRYERLQ